MLCSNLIVYYNFTTISHRYSRKLIWMELAPVHHNPRIICNYFMTAVAERAGMIVIVMGVVWTVIDISLGFPTMLRADCGTENSLVGIIQLALRSLHLDQWHDKAIRFGKSTTNTVSDVFTACTLRWCSYELYITSYCLANWGDVVISSQTENFLVDWQT